MNKKAVGNTGELVVREYLEENGYKILKHNEKIAGVEIDILARKDNTLVFCEVKTRENDHFGRGIEGVSQTQQKRYLRAASLMSAKDKYKNMDIRFDVIEVTRGKINHVEDAFRG